MLIFRMVMCFYYFAISFDSVNLSEDKVTGFMLSGAIELPGGILAIPLLRFFGRRSVSIFALIFQGIATSISPFVRSMLQIFVCGIFNSF